MNDVPANLAGLSLQVLIICGLLISGLLMYYLYDPEIIFLTWLHLSNPNPLIVDTPFEYVLNAYFADTVWCLALVQAVSILRDYQIPQGYRQALIALPFFSEAMQFAAFIPGVFDWIDMSVYFLISFPTLIKEFMPMLTLKNNLKGSFAIAIFTFALLASGRPDPVYVTGTFTLLPEKDDIFTKTALVKSLDISANPSIVLRVPNPGSKVTEEQKQKNSVLYNLIEKEFAKAGFVVRDRQLFDKVLDQETSDYSKIGIITETDFILELLRYDLERKVITSSYVDEDGQPAEVPYRVSFNGAVAEFKLVSVKKNDMVGSYTFYWTPCTDGCKERFDIKASSWSVHNSVPTDFFKTAAQHVVKEMGLLR